MATLEEMQRLFSKMPIEDPVDWLVSSQPVVARFKKAGDADTDQLFGLPSTHNGESDILTFWIGLRKSTRELLVTLTIRLTIGPERHTRKKSLRKGRLMFLVIPAESLAIDCGEVSFDSLIKNPIFKHVLDVPSDGDLASCKVSEIKVDGGTSKSFVLMPNDEVTGEQSRPSMDLLDQLKSLSETSSFCLFASYNPTLRESVKYIRQLMSDRVASPLKTPNIECKAFYPGRRMAARDVWERQGWRPREEVKISHKKDVYHDAPPYTRLSASQKDLDKASHRANLPPSPPPRYAPCPLDARTPVPGPCAPPSEIHQDPPSVASTDDNRPFSGPPSATVSSYERIFSSKTPPPLRPSEPSLSPNYSADLLSEDSRKSRIGYNRHEDPISSDPGAFRQVAQSSNIRSGQGAATFRALSPSSFVAATPCKRRLTSFNHRSIVPSKLSTPASLPTEQSDNVRYIGDVHHQNMLQMMRSGVHISSTVADDPSLQNTLLPDNSQDLPESAASSAHDTDIHAGKSESRDEARDLETRLTQWLIQAWTVLPDVHYIFITDLLTLSSSICNNDTEAFDDGRSALTTSLLRYCAELNPDMGVRTQTATSPDSRTVRAMLPRLVSWLYVLDPDGSVIAFADLLSISLLEQRVLSCKESFVEVFKSYTKEIACVISRACVRASQRQERGDIEIRMRQENQRRM